MLLLFSKGHDEYGDDERSIFYKLSLLIIDFYILSFLSVMILNIKIFYLCKKTTMLYPLSYYLLPNLKIYIKGNHGDFLKIFALVILGYVGLIIVKKICLKILN